MEKTPYELRDYLRILWERKVTIIAVTAIVTLASLFFSFRQPRRYESSAEVQVYPVYLPIAGVSGQTSFIPMENELRVAQSASVAQAAAESLPDHESLASISVSNPSNTQVLLFTATSQVPQYAQNTAQAYAQAYLGSRRDTFVGSARDAARTLKTQVAKLEAQRERLNEEILEAGSEAERNALETQVNVLLGLQGDKEALLSQLELVEQVSVGRTLADAYFPLAPSSPDNRRAFALGLFVGFALGVAVALLLERLDPRVRGREDVEAAALAPVAAYIPHDARLTSHLAFDPSTDPHLADGYRTLRTRLQFAAAQEELKTLLVTSASAGEGKTTTAVNLSAALARADIDVVLVGADLRRPDFERYFTRLPDRGLADVLAGRCGLDDVTTSTRFPHLHVIPGGVVETIPEGALNSAAMRDVLSDLVANVDMVVIDAPPILGAAEALDLAPIVDKVLLVADARTTTRESLSEASREVRSVGGDVMAVVLGNLDPRRHHPQYRGTTYTIDQSRTPTTTPSDHAGEGVNASTGLRRYTAESRPLD